jgi:AAA ATPase containing von Willebrand factor type A (vWA) domain
MSSISKTDQLSARVSVKVPRPDSLVEVRVSPPDSNFQVKVSPGDDVIELLIQPGASMVEVRISPPSEEESEKLAGQFRLPSGAHFQPEPAPGQGDGEPSPTGDEVLPGVSRAEFAAMVEEEESAEAKKLLDQMAEDENVAAESRPASGYQLPDEVKELLASDADDEDELNRLDEMLSPKADGVDIDEPEALELAPDQAAEVLPEAPAEESIAPEAELEEMMDEEAMAGPAPEELAAAEAGPDLTETDQPTVAGPKPDDLAEVAAPAASDAVELDEFDLPEADEAAQAAAPADPITDEPDEFDLPDADEEPTADETEQAAAPVDLVTDEPDEFDLPEAVEEPAADEAVQAAESKAEDPHELEPPASDNSLEALTLENDALQAKPGPAETGAAASAQAEPAASQTLEWVPVNPGGTPIEEDEPIDPDVIGAAALDALARLNLAVQEEQAAMMEAAAQPAAKPLSGEATAAATSFSSADSTIMVEMYDDYEPGPNPADTITPPPEDELMDLSQVEKDEDLAIEPIDVDGLGELDLEKSHFAETRNGSPTIKARPMVQVIPGNTVVPE